MANVERVLRLMIYTDTTGKVFDALSGEEVTDLPPNIVPFWGYFLDKDGVEHHISELFNGGGGGGAVSSVNGKTGAVVLTASDLGVPNIMSIKGEAASYDALPSTYEVGDVYQTQDTKHLWVATDEGWIDLGQSIVDLSNYYSKTESDSLYLTKNEGTTNYYTKSQVNDSFYNKTQTEALLDTHKSEADAKYQAKLTPGDNISISEDNVISASGGGGPTTESDPVFSAWRDGQYTSDKTNIEARVSTLESSSGDVEDELITLTTRINNQDSTIQAQTTAINTLTSELSESKGDISQNTDDINALEANAASMVSTISVLSGRTVTLDQNKANKFTLNEQIMDLQDVYNAIGDSGIPDTPDDGKLYYRKHGEWVESSAQLALTKWVQKITDTDGSKITWPLTQGTAMYIQGVRSRHEDGSISIFWQGDDYTLNSDNTITFSVAPASGDTVGLEYVGRAS